MKQIIILGAKIQSFSEMREYSVLNCYDKNSMPHSVLHSAFPIGNRHSCFASRSDFFEFLSIIVEFVGKGTIPFTQIIRQRTIPLRY